ncbi:hypothetical protein [Herbidospora sp. RD11066]
MSNQEDAARRGMGPDLPLIGMKLAVTLNLALNPWRDLRHTPAAGQGVVERIGLVPGRTAKGRPTVAMIVRLADGSHAVAECTWALLESAVRAMAASPVAELDRLENP